VTLAGPLPVRSHGADPISSRSSTTCSITNSRLMVLVTIGLVVVQEMCSRLGAYTGQGWAR
jgi:hypothetical protein